MLRLTKRVPAAQGQIIRNIEVLPKEAGWRYETGMWKFFAAQGPGARTRAIEVRLR